MEFVFETIYDQKAMTAMARALRKTIRKKRSRRSHIFGWVVLVLSLLLTLPLDGGGWEISARTVFTWLVILVLLAALLFEDWINGYVARRRMLAGMEKAVSVFNEEGYHSTTDIGETKWHYENITLIAEMKDYYIFVFDRSHGQVYDKKALSGGTTEEFRAFIAEKTGKEIQKIS